jgi:hypothetical protein
VWSERWQSPEDKLRALEGVLREEGACVLRGGDFDRWDLELRGGMFCAARLHMTVEEHGAGKQLARFRAWPDFSFQGLSLLVPFAALASMSALDGARVAPLALAAGALLLAARGLHECAIAMSTVMRAVRELEERETREADAHAPGVLAPVALETETPGGVEEIPLALARGAAAGAGGARHEATVPPSAVSSVGSSLFLNQLPVAASSGVAELQHHQSFERD